MILYLKIINIIFMRIFYQVKIMYILSVFVYQLLQRFRIEFHDSNLWYYWLIKNMIIFFDALEIQLDWECLFIFKSLRVTCVYSDNKFTSTKLRLMWQSNYLGTIKKPTSCLVCVYIWRRTVILLDWPSMTKIYNYDYVPYTTTTVLCEL